MSTKSARAAAKAIAKCIIAISTLCILFEAAGCGNITVVRPLDPTSAGVKKPVSSVRLSFSTGPFKAGFVNRLQAEAIDPRTVPAFADESCFFIIKNFDDALTKELRRAGLAASHLGSADFSMNVVLSNIGLGTMELQDNWGQVVKRQLAASNATWDISYVGANGTKFGAIRLENIGLNDYSQQQIAKEVADFTREGLIETPKK